MSHYPTDPARQAVIDVNAAVVRALSEAGAGLLVGTDAGCPGIVYGASVHEELKAFVDAGLSPYRALRAATRDAADFVGEAGQWGEVTAGTRADLLLLDANPLDDVANAGRLAGVMVRGRWLPESEIAELLADLAARRRAPVGTRRRPIASLPASADGERLRFDLAWDGFELGTEEVVCEPERSGGRRIVSAADLDGGLGASENADAGAYEMAVTVDAGGVDQSAWFELANDDGLDRVELTRADGRVVVTHRHAVGNQQDDVIDDPDGQALLARPQTAMYVRLAERLAGLDVGDRVDIPVIGPALPPDPTVKTATLRAVRLLSGRLRRRGALRRRVQTAELDHGSLLVCDSANRPVRLEHGTDMSYWERSTSTEDVDPASVIFVTRGESHRS